MRKSAMTKMTKKKKWLGCGNERDDFEEASVAESTAETKNGINK
jgi:hypothetical protein